jgi:hypothetical protein
MSVETLTYSALGERLKISPGAARSLAKRLRLPRAVSDDGKARVSVDLAEIRHTPQRPGRRQAGNVVLLRARVAALQTEIARLQATAAGHRADFERERDRADRMLAELLQATADAAAAKEAAARLEGEVAALRTGGRASGSSEGPGQATSRLGQLAATLVQADRKAARG